MKRGWLLCPLCLLASLHSSVSAAATENLLEDGFWIVAHRGASGTLPEHTAAGYKLAIQQGANFIECDVVLTKDCHPICRHEPDISQTTDAATKFPDRKKNLTIDGKVHEGIFAIDFSLAEIKTLRAVQPKAYRDQSFNRLYQVPTLLENIAIAQSSARPVGIYPEIKHPSWHDSQNLTCLRGSSISALVLQVLRDYGYGAGFGTAAWRQRPAFIQSFEVNNLKWLKQHTDIPLLQLMDDAHEHAADTDVTYGEMMRDDGLAAVAQYAKGIGPWKGTMVPGDGSEPEAVGYKLGSRAHKYGLLVHPYTFRDDASLLAARWNQQPEQEYQHFINEEDIDGCFTDHPARLAAVLEARQAPKAKRATNTLRSMTKAAYNLALRQTLAEI